MWLPVLVFVLVGADYAANGTATKTDDIIEL